MKKKVMINKGTTINPYNPSSFPCMISIAGKYSNGEKYFKNSYLSLIFAINEIIYTPITIEVIMVPVRLWLFVSTEANKPASTKVIVRVK